MLCPECGSAMELIEEAHTEVYPTAYERWWECEWCGTCVTYDGITPPDDYPDWAYDE